MRTGGPRLLAGWLGAVALGTLLAGCVAVPTSGSAAPGTTTTPPTTAVSTAATTTTVVVPTQPPAGTRVIGFHPWLHGQVDPALRVTQTAQGDCADPSSATSRPDAFRCVTGSQIADPCFADTASANPTQVACVLSPTEVAVLNLGTPLATIAPDSATEDPVFLLVLDDGTQCHANTGAGPAPQGGLAVTMYCGTGATYVWGQPDMTGSTWTVRMGADGGSLSTAKVRAVYR